MENKKSKKQLVKILLNQEMNEKNEEELLDLIVDNSIAVDIDKEEERNRTRGDKIADKMSEIAGSWSFIIIFLIFMLSWIILNTIILKDKIDDYPFILLNLILSCIAALQAPIIMMSQNRQAKKDSMRSRNDYKIDLKSELILEELHDKLDDLIKNQKKIIKYIDEKTNK
ncbi:MAG: DUF1003 domain-containing protein [Bacilli bacterium]|nr:DUF1003 domain-containing protein [Bacilli bacterium]